MRLSVIIPTHNRAASLARTVRSVLELDYPSDRCEILVIDDSSTDETAAAVHELQRAAGGRAIRYSRGEHLEVTEARHIGARAAGGELLLFLDDDVTLAPQWARAYASAFTTHDNMAAAGGPIRAAWEVPPPEWLAEFIDRKYPYTGGEIQFGPLTLFERADEFVVDPRGYFFSANMAVRRDVFFEVGGFNPDALGRDVLGDGEIGLASKLWARGLLVGYVPDAELEHHITPDRMTVGYLRRRMSRQGSVDAYTHFHPNVPGRRVLARHAVRLASRAARRSVKAAARWNRTDPASLIAQMEAAQAAQRLRYTVRLMFDPKRRALVEREGWLETSSNDEHAVLGARDRLATPTVRELAAKVPGARGTVRRVRQWRRARAEREYWRRFAGDCYGCWWGVFTSFEEAIRSAPDTKPVGATTPELAAEHRVMLEQENWEGRGSLLNSYDYPVLFWLSQLLMDDSTRKVFDFGGSVGLHFYTYGARLRFPPDLRWTICELPAISEVGRQVATERDADVRFTTSFEEADGEDVLLASAIVQDVGDLGDMLRGLQRPPRHVLINRLPLDDGPAFVTLQNAGSAFCPMYVFNYDEFIDSLVAAGYELVDTWDDLVDGCIIPFHNKAVPYRGFYLRLINPGTST
jgi:putative methyltransferase (TIGR04325 family)